MKTRLTPMAFNTLMMITVGMFLSTGCEKDNNKDIVDNPEDETTSIYPLATGITISDHSARSRDLDRVQFTYRKGVIQSSTFDLDTVGDWRMSVHGKGGRNILGKFRGQSTNMANYFMVDGGGDTIRLTNLSSGTHADIILDEWDKINSRIDFYSPSNTPEATSRTVFNDFVSSLKNRKFKRVFF